MALTVDLPPVDNKLNTRCMLSSRGRTHMSEPQGQEQTPTVQQLAIEVARLRERVEDLETPESLTQPFAAMVISL